MSGFGVATKPTLPFTVRSKTIKLDENNRLITVDGSTTFNEAVTNLSASLEVLRCKLNRQLIEDLRTQLHKSKTSEDDTIFRPSQRCHESRISILSCYIPEATDKIVVAIMENDTATFASYLTKTNLATSIPVNDYSLQLNSGTVEFNKLGEVKCGRDAKKIGYITTYQDFTETVELSIKQDFALTPLLLALLTKRDEMFFEMLGRYPGSIKDINLNGISLLELIIACNPNLIIPALERLQIQSLALDVSRVAPRP